MATLEKMLPSKLETFYYQVGGHFILMSLGDIYLCKPRGRRENVFYESIPDLLKEFLPTYHGVVSVHIEKVEEVDEMIYVAHRTRSSSCIFDMTQIMTFSEERQMFRCMSKINIDSPVMRVMCREQPFAPGLDESGFRNPWTDIITRTLNRTLKQNNITQHDYIVLEDVTKQFNCPCVVDLKIGTRSHGDLASPEKCLRHSQRAALSPYGVRLAGMLVYDNVKKSYKFHDGQTCKKILNEKFFESLKSFFFDGRSYQLDVLEELVKELHKLRDVISQLDTYRFFSSSLLVVYEGFKQETTENGTSTITDSFQVPYKPNHSLVDVRMIDFENVTHSGYTSDPVAYHGPDEGALLGLTTIIDLLQSLLKDYT